jgi:hypothetical protein
LATCCHHSLLLLLLLLLRRPCLACCTHRCQLLLFPDLLLLLLAAPLHQHTQPAMKQRHYTQSEMLDCTVHAWGLCPKHVQLQCILFAPTSDVCAHIK